MSVSIRGCPACNSMVLGDSAKCPHCGHVLDAKRASSDFLELIPASELEMSEADDELPCRQCGEMVRTGLVRCWHCGAFTNPEIEATYQRMQANPSPIMFSDISNADAPDSPEDAERFQPQFGGADDDGFELQDGSHFPAIGHVNRTSYPAHTTPANYSHDAAGADDDGDFTLNTSASAGFVADQYSADPAEQSGSVPPAYDPSAYNQAAYDQAAYDQYQQQYGDQQGMAQGEYAVDPNAWQQVGYYDPNAQSGEPGYYDPNAQPGEPGYYNPDAQPGEPGYFAPSTAYDPNVAYDPNTGYPYDPNAQYDQTGYAVQEGAIPESTYPTQEAGDAPILELPGTETEVVDGAATGESSGSAGSSGPDVAHSVSTGGEALLAAAIEEEKQSIQSRKMYGRRRVTGQALPPGAFLVFCPNGHKVQVYDRHRGRAGRCPNCKAVFFVPAAVLETPSTEVEGQAGPAATDQTFKAGAYDRWMFELRLHTVSPTKLKLKPGAMAGEYDIADLAFSDSDLLVATVFKRGGTFAAMQEKKKKPATRLAMSDYLQSKKPVAGMPVPFQTVVASIDAGQLKIVQPAVPGEESIFAGIPVFGPGRIVVRLPAMLDGGSRVYISFNLSEFREFSRLLEQRMGIAGFGLELGIPLSDVTTTYKCHYSDIEINALENLEFYQNDPALKPIVIGRKCSGCGLVVGEDARKKEKIGGKTDASVAKAVCPKCKKKFGDKTFYGLDPNAKPVVFGILPPEA